MLGQVSCSAGKQIRKDDDMAQHSRQVLVTSIDEVTIEHRQIPAAGRGELLINSTVVGICGSDTHAAQGRHPFIDLPYRPGHEVVGVVAEVGPGVTEVSVGERVAIEPNLSCGQCRQCTSGRYNICEKLKVFGCQTPGGMANCGHRPCTSPTRRPSFVLYQRPLTIIGRPPPLGTSRQ